MSPTVEYCSQILVSLTIPYLLLLTLSSHKTGFLPIYSHSRAQDTEEKSGSFDRNSFLRSVTKNGHIYPRDSARVYCIEYSNLSFKVNKFILSTVTKHNFII